MARATGSRAAARAASSRDWTPATPARTSAYTAVEALSITKTCAGRRVCWRSVIVPAPVVAAARTSGRARPGPGRHGRPSRGRSQRGRQRRQLVLSRREARAALIRGRAGGDDLRLRGVQRRAKTLARRPEARELRLERRGAHALLVEGGLDRADRYRRDGQGRIRRGP